MAVRDYVLRAAGLAGAVTGLTVATVLLIVGCALIGIAVAGGRGAVVAIVVAVVPIAAVCTCCDRLALSAMLARPVSEVEHPELYRLVRELSKAGRLPVPRLYVSPAEQPNSFAVGRSPRAATVCCTEGLLRALDEAELRGVLGHELAHVSGRDILASSISAGLATIITFPAGIARFLPGRSEAVFSGRAGASSSARAGAVSSARAGAVSSARAGAVSSARASAATPAAGVPPAVGARAGTSGLGLLEALLMLALGPVAALVIRLAVTQEREYRADADGALLSGDPVALANALRKIDAGTEDLALGPDGRLTSVGHLMIACPFRTEGFARLFLTHPPAGERVRRLEALAGYRR
jgi:heat shock protein HtpX